MLLRKSKYVKGVEGKTLFSHIFHINNLPVMLYPLFKFNTAFVVIKVCQFHKFFMGASTKKVKKKLKIYLLQFLSNLFESFYSLHKFFI